MAYRARRSQRATESGTNTGPHKTLRKYLLEAWKPGDPCARCGQPMLYRWLIKPDGSRVTALHLDHTDDRSGYRGLSHATCNLRDGQAKTTAILRARGGALTPQQLAAIRAKQWQASVAAQARARS